MIVKQEWQEVQDNFIKELYDVEKAKDPQIDATVSLFLISHYSFMEEPTEPHIRWWWTWMWNIGRRAIDRQGDLIYA